MMLLGFKHITGDDVFNLVGNGSAFFAKIRSKMRCVAMRLVSLMMCVFKKHHRGNTSFKK